mmetsp:Transcript_20634/g.44870  ORF Transcript_20634/g.44870 Transcript_20634/m.44870 type:complete len:118 (-) Transcript_20634:42-395(-)
MDLKDIPDRWKRFNPEKPPYKYWPGRTRTQTLTWSFGALAGFGVLGFILYELSGRAAAANEDKVKEYARTHMTREQATMIKFQQEAWDRMAAQQRRKALGLPAAAHGSVEMKDPFDE